MSLELIKGITFIETDSKTLNIVIDAILDNIESTQGKVFLDIGSGNGKVVNSFNQKTNTRSIGVEIQEALFKESISKYPELEFHNALIEDKLEIVNEADIIFINNASMPNDLFWRIWESIKPGAIVVYNNVSLSIKLKRRLDHSVSEIRVSKHLPIQEYHLVIKN
jgi:precorrin-6B methylase 2